MIMSIIEFLKRAMVSFSIKRVYIINIIFYAIIAVNKLGCGNYNNVTYNTK